MKALLIFLATTTLAWGFPSPYESSVDGISIANTHELAEGVLRGAEPGGKIQELVDYGITDVIIFKHQTRNEVDAELAGLEEAGITGHHIPFRWKDLVSLEDACGQVVEALKIIKSVRRAGGSVFFHCTVGEDRTGILAGLFRMQEEGISSEEAWEEEMCPRGYADGNRNKPAHVFGAIHESLTPLFLAMAARLEAGKTLTASACANLDFDVPAKTCR